MANDPANDTSTQDASDGAQWLARAKTAFERPLVAVVFVVAAGLTIFYLGTRIGDAAGRAFDGDGVAMVVFFAVLVAVVVGVIALGVTLDRRKRDRAADAES